MNLPGGGGGVVDAEDWPTCGQECARSPVCAAWTWDPRSGLCFVKTSVPAPVRATGMVSGFIHH
jgi:hypothetical protein